LASLLGLAFISFACASATARESWILREEEVGCALDHVEGDRYLVLAMLSIPDHKDAGILLWQFRDASFDRSPSSGSGVTLNFDSGVVDEYRIKPLDDGGYEVKMMTYDLRAILDKARAATTLSIEAGTSKAMFDMRGFGDLLPALQECAKARAK
jgi:hypothetical protein